MMCPARRGAISCTSATPSTPKSNVPRSPAAASAAGSSKRSIPAPLPPMFALTRIGNRRPAPAATIACGLLASRVLGYGTPELLEQVQLERLRRVHLVCRRAVHHGDADPLQVPEPLQRVERRLSMPAQIGGRTRAVEHQRIRHAAFGRIVGVRRRIEADVRDPPAIQLGKQGTEPVRMLVENGDRLHRNSRMKEAAEYTCGAASEKIANGHGPQSPVPVSSPEPPLPFTNSWAWLKGPRSRLEPRGRPLIPARSVCGHRPRRWPCDRDPGTWRPPRGRRPR